MTPKIKNRVNVVRQMLQQHGVPFVFKKIFSKLYRHLKAHPLLRIAPPLPEGIPFSSDPNYQSWLIQNHPRPSDIQRMQTILPALLYQPKVSILMPVYNPPVAFLSAAIESVLSQTYPHWELCLTDDASTNPEVPKLLQHYAQHDKRIKVTTHDENQHISQASNTALNMATGEFVALLDHDDCLTAHALFEAIVVLNKDRELDMIYSDEDKIDEKDQLSSPFFKPDWSPDTLLSQMYTCHLGIYRRSLVNAIGGFREGFEGAQDYDLVLRLTEKTEKIFHIPQILYHWRMHSGSTALDLDNKDYATEASIQALSDALKRRQELGTVIPAPYCHFLVKYEVLEPELVSVIIPTRDLGEMLDQCLVSLFQNTNYPNYEILILDNGSQEAKTFEIFKTWQTQKPAHVRVSSLDIPFNYSKINNYAVQQTKGKYLLFLNNDTEVITADWMADMVGQAQRPSIGAVGGMLLYPDQTIQHAGIILGIQSTCGLSHQYFSSVASGYQNKLQTIQNYAAVTAACLMCRRRVFEEVGGFEEALPGNYNDVDFCLKLLERGYWNVYLPFVRLIHHESKSRGFDISVEQQKRFEQEAHFLQERWSHLIKADPFYNPNLSRKVADYHIHLGSIQK